MKVIGRKIRKMALVFLFVHFLGLCSYANGDTYDGQWKDDLKNDKGVFTYNNGDLYEGEMGNDKRNGHGKAVQ